MKLLCGSILTCLILLIVSCSSQPLLDQEGCLPGTPFILGPDGGEFKFEQWAFSVKPGNLKEPTLFTAKQCPNKDFNHKITHHFVGTESGDIVTVEATHPINPAYPTIKIELASKEISADSINLLACQTANSGDDARQLITTNHLEALTPAFGMEPTVSSKCYTATFSSLAADDGGYTAWFSTLQSAFDQVTTVAGETLDQYMAAVENFAQETYKIYVSSCYTCKATANFLINKITCSGLAVGEFKKAGCMAAIAGLSLGTGALLSSVICAGLIWTLDGLEKKLAGKTITDLCNDSFGFTPLANNLKTQICDLCNTYMPSFNCTLDDTSKAVCPKLACKDILYEESCSTDPEGCIWTIGNQCAKK